MDEEDTGCGDLLESGNAKVMKSHSNQSPLSEPMSDRISELQDKLKICILSLLDTNEAVRTCILSKKWENLWKSVDSFVFWYDAGYGDLTEKTKFISLVDGTLMRCALPKVKRLSLLGLHDDIGLQTADKWLQFALEKNVEFLKLDIPGSKYNASGWSRKNLQLVELDICIGILYLGRVVSWTYLKKLTLRKMGMDDKTMAKILKGCPVLETLSLIEVCGLKHLNIVSRNVKKLEVYQNHKSNDLLDITAPWLEEIDLNGSVVEVNPCLINVSSLVNANLTFRPYMLDFDGSRMFRDAAKILQKVDHAKELTLSSFFIEALSYLKLIEKPSPLFDCKYATVGFPIMKYNLPGIADLLQSSAYLETLIIKIVTLDKFEFCGYVDEICDFDGKSYLSMQMANFPHLKTVEVDYNCTESCYRDEVRNNKKACYECYDFELIEFILKNVVVLEKLVIKSRKYRYCKCSDNCSLQYVSRMSHKLLGVCNDGGGDKEFELKTNQSDFEFRICNSGSKSS